MTGWYSLVPAGAVALGNLTPVGQNSGQVGCRFPPNGHHLAACLHLPAECQLWGPFWHWNSRPTKVYITLPQTVYHLEADGLNSNQLPTRIYRSQWQEGRWQVRSDHYQKTPLNIGGEFLIEGGYFAKFWQNKELANPPLIPISQIWQTLTLSHNRRQDYLVPDEAGFFAEMATLIQPGWSILVKVWGDYTHPESGCLGAGATPVAINPLPKIRDQWLHSTPEKPQGAVLLTGALWRKEPESKARPHLEPVSTPCPTFDNGSRVIAYAAETGVPWQSWTKVSHRHFESQTVRVLTPGEWLTPAGAVYLWEENNSPVSKSEPLRNPPDSPDYLKRFNHWALGYGHLWLY